MGSLDEEQRLSDGKFLTFPKTFQLQMSFNGVFEVVLVVHLVKCYRWHVCLYTVELMLLQRTL